MPDIPWYDRKAKKLAAREWTELRSGWLPHVPLEGYPKGESEDQAITEVEDLPGLSEAVLGVNGDQPVVQPMVAGLPTLTLGESLLVLHKAIHVLGASQVHVGAGMCSWSTASAYQAALFGAHGILRLLRVVTVQFESSNYLLDLWPEPAKKLSRGTQMLVLRMPIPRLEHRPVWAAFLRLLRVATVPREIWPPELIAELSSLEVQDFARQRNALHYKLPAWPLADLRVPRVITGFGALTPLSDGCLDPDLDDFSVRLGIGVLRLAAGLLKDLAAAAPSLAPDAASLDTWVAGVHYAVYRSSAV